MTKPTYVLGTGLSHDGSACLLKDGEIRFAIEKERVTRIKHDGGGDSEAIGYCLNAEGIKLNDLSLIVQNANFGMFEYGNAYYKTAKRILDERCRVPVVTISHHLAHAYSALAMAPFEEMGILVIDGCGSGFDEVIDNNGTVNAAKPESDCKHLWFEKDSFYLYRGGRLHPVFKDFSQAGMVTKAYPMHPPITMHSIGGVYHAASEYCLGDLNDVGKLMGLAPYGRPGQFSGQIFDLTEGRVFVRYDWMREFRAPLRDSSCFKRDFQYYADIAHWVQKEVERAILYVVNERRKLAPTENLAYTGGVALNAVANRLLRAESGYKNVFITPAAGDNGLALGCAYYGWCEVLKRERVLHSGSTCLGKPYHDGSIEFALDSFVIPKTAHVAARSILDIIAQCVSAAPGKSEEEIGFIIEAAGEFHLRVDSDGATVREGPSSGSGNCVICAVAHLTQLISTLGELIPMVRSQQILIKGDGVRPFLRKRINWKDARDALRRLVESTAGNGCVPHIHRAKEIALETASLLAQGKVVGWFQGASEFGPRALGNRSILADPGKEGARDFINSRIKFREDFRPFAPSVIQEDASTYFEHEGDSPYMLLVAKVREKWKKRLLNVVHADDSSRIQTVTPESNRRYYELLRAYKDLTGISVLLNTSLNRRGTPIVETPEQALVLFYETELDALVMEDYIVTK